MKAGSQIYRLHRRRHVSTPTQGSSRNRFPRTTLSTPPFQHALHIHTVYYTFLSNDSRLCFSPHTIHFISPHDLKDILIPDQIYSLIPHHHSSATPPAHFRTSYSVSFHTRQQQASHFSTPSHTAAPTVTNVCISDEVHIYSLPRKHRGSSHRPPPYCTTSLPDPHQSNHAISIPYF